MIVPVLAFLAAVYILGVGNGLALAWAQPARFRYWAARTERAYVAARRAADEAQGIEPVQLEVER